MSRPRVRRSLLIGTSNQGPTLWTPSSLTGLWGWWDAAKGITLDGSNLVQEWDDQSGNSRNWVNSTSAANRPGYTAAGINSLPSLTASGNQWLNLALGWPSTNFFMAMVAQTSSGGFQGIMADTNGPDSWNFSANSLGLGLYSNSNLFYASTIFNFSGVPGTNPFIWEFSDVYAGTLNTWMNGTAEIVGNGGFHGTNGNLILLSGYTGHWTGKLSEIVICSTIPSGADQLSLRNYLNNKYACF